MAERRRSSACGGGGGSRRNLWHVGQKRSNKTPDWTPPVPYESPSGIATDGSVVGTPMTESDIADTIAAFARGAADAERIGFDAVELHGAHSYLIDQLFLGDLNHREDVYGGTTLLERSRFAVEVLRAVRSAVSRDFPVSLRLSQSKPGLFHGRLAETPAQL